MSQAFPIYTLRNNGVTISTAISALQLAASTTSPIEILRFALTQGTSTTSAQIAARLVRKTAAATVTAAVAGTTLNKNNPIMPTSAAQLGTALTGITASAEGTNGEIDIERAFNVLNGLEWLASDAEQIIVPSGGIIALQFSVAPPSATWYAEIVFRELRGS